MLSQKVLSKPYHKQGATAHNIQYTVLSNPLGRLLCTNKFLSTQQEIITNTLRSLTVY